MSNQNIQRYHVTIKDLISSETQGFMLNAGKDGHTISFSYQTLAPLMLKTQQGEITMGDLTNTSVFVQFNRAGKQVDQFQQTPIGPRGYKFWTPRYVYGNFLPTQLYWYGQWVDTVTQPWEIRLTPAASVVSTFPAGEKVSCREIDEADLYIGCSTSAKIYKSSDKGATWTTLADMADYGAFTKTRQLMIIKDKKCKKLAIVCGTLGTQANGNLFTYVLSDSYGFDVIKDYSGKFYDLNTNFEWRYPDAPSSVSLRACTNAGPYTYTYVYNAVTGGNTANYYVKIQNIKWNKALLITRLNADMVKAIAYVNTVGLYEWGGGSGSYLDKIDVLCLNNGLTPITYQFDDDQTTITVPVNGLLIDYHAYDPTLNHAVVTQNHIMMADTSDLEPGMILDTSSGNVKIVCVEANGIRVNENVPDAELSYMGWHFNILASSFKQVFKLNTYIEWKSLLGTKFTTPGWTSFTITEEYSEDTIGTVANYRNIYFKNNKMFYAPGRCKTTPIVVVADRDIGSWDKICPLQRIQKCWSSTDTHNIIQLVKLWYDETSTQAESYIWAIVYYSTDKIPYQLIPLQLLSIKDKRLRDPSIDTYAATDFQKNEYQNYYNSYAYDISYLCEKKYMTQWFDEDIPTTVAGYPISIAYDDVSNTSYFSTYKKIGGDTITIRKSTPPDPLSFMAWVEKDTDIPGVWYATGLQYDNDKLFFASQAKGRVYQYVTITGTGGYATSKEYSVSYEEVYMNGKLASNIQVGTVFEWAYVCMSDTNGVCYQFDTLDPTCPFTEKFNIETIGLNNYVINAIIPLGGDLILQSSHWEIYRWNATNAPGSRWFLVSSNHGSYLGSIKKNYIQARVILNNQFTVTDKGQKVRLAVSFDNGQTFNYLSKVRGDPFIADNFYAATTANYEQWYADFGWPHKNELVFRFPYDAICQTICYKIEVRKWTCTALEMVVNHIELHYVLQSFKELYLNMSVDLRPRVKLLDNSIENAPDAHRQKLAFLQTIWLEQRKCEIRLPRWDTYFAIPFAMPNTWTDGFGVTAMDISTGKKDLDLFTYAVQISFKTIT